MRVLVIGTDATIFQKNSDARGRTEEYARLFDEYHMIIYSRPGFQQEAVPPLFIYPTNSRFYFFRPFGAFRIGKKIIHERGIGFVSVQDPAETGLAGWLLKKATGVKLHIQIHADFFSPFFRRNSWKERLRYWLARFIIPRGDAWRVVSERIRRSLISNFNPSTPLGVKFPRPRPGSAEGGLISKPVVMLPIFVDRERIASAKPIFNLRPKYPQFDFIILIVSRLMREKNISLAIYAFHELLKEFPKTGLIIVGDGPEKLNLQLTTNDLQLTDNICFEGWQDNLVSYYKTADLYLLTSNFEGYGRTVVEAAAAGLPIVMTDVGVAGEIIRNGETGRIVGVGNKDALIQALREARNNYPGMRRMAARAQAEVLAMEPRMWEEYLESYRTSLKL